MHLFLLLGHGCGEPGPTANPDKDSTVDETGDSPAETGETGDSGEASSFLEFDGPAPKNLLLLSLDTVRRDQVGYFTGLDTTPNLDALMGQSVVLENHRSCSNWTAPSILCIYTGRLPWDDGYFPTQIYKKDGGDPDVPWIPDDLRTLANTYQDAGYNTLLVTANGVYSDRVGGGLANGFAEIRLPLWFAAPDVADKGELAASELVADGRPWMLGLHFIDPHHPYKAPIEYATDADELGPFQWDIGDEHELDVIEAAWPDMDEATREEATNWIHTVYRAELRYWDESFGELWANLDATGALDDTLVVFFSDHGEQFGEHGGFHHGASLYEGENRAITFFWAKNLQPKVWTGPTSHEDLAPTILDAMGMEPDPTYTGLKVGTAPEDRVQIKFNYIYGWGDPNIAVVKNDYKLIYYWNSEKHFQDLATDPDEVTNLYSPSDTRVTEYWDYLLPEVEKIQAEWPTLVPVAAGP